LAGDVPLALGTAQGVVKRLAPEEPPQRDAWDVISLKADDAVVGAAVAGDDAELVFVASDAQLLRYPASLVRPQGRPAAGMAGMNVADDARAIFFGVVAPDATEPVVLTIAGPSGALPGTTPGTAKLTPLSEYPGKGRGTGGVRAHKFLKDEDALLLAWAGPTPARAVSGAGQ